MFPNARSIWLLYIFKTYLPNDPCISQAQAAFSSIGSTGCQITEIDCICKDQAFLASLLPVVEESCDRADLQSMFD